MFAVFANISLDMNPYRRDLKTAESEARRSAQQIERDFTGTMSGAASKVGGIFAGVGKTIGNVFTGIGLGAGMKVFEVGLGSITKLAGGFQDALLGLGNESEAAQARINAFTKDTAQTAKILSMVRDEAAKTPFAFQEMANATGALLPVAKGAKVGIQDLLKQAEILAASNPLQGLEGASFALREAMNGDFTSIIERFDLSRTSINKWKAEGVSNMEIVTRAMKEMGYDSDLVGKMGETLAGRWSTFNDTLDQLKLTLTTPLFNVLKGWLVSIQGLLDANQPRLEAFATTMGEKIATAAEAAANWFGQLFARARDLWPTIQPLIGGFMNFASGVLSAGQAVWGAIDAFRTGKTTLAEFIGGMEIMGTTILGNLGKLKDQVSPYIGQAFSALGSAVQQYGPQVLAQLGIWGGRAAHALADWVTQDAVPFVQANLPGWVSAITGWLGNTALPAVGSALVAIGTAFGDWVATKAVPWVQTNLPGWLAAIGTWISETAVPAIITKGAELGAAFIKWVKDSWPDTQKALLSWWTSATSWLGGVLVALGEWTASMGKKFVEWISKDETQKQLDDVGRTLVNWFDDALNKTNKWSSDMGVKAHEWLMNNGPLWLHDWGELWRVLTDNEDNIFNKTNDWSAKMGVKAGEWLDKQGPLWLHDWGELGRVTHDKLMEMDGDITKFTDAFGRTLNGWLMSVTPTWLQSWSNLGNAMKNGIIGGANGAIDALNGFASKLAGVMNGIAGKLGLPQTWSFGQIGHVGGGASQGGGGTGGQVSAYAGGTASAPGGLAWVGEGNGGAGAELVRLAPGSTVIPHDVSMRMVDAGLVPHWTDPTVKKYAEGFNIPGLGSLADFFKNTPAKVVDLATRAAGLSPDTLGVGLLKDFAGAVFTQVKDMLIAKVKEWVSKAIPVGPEAVQRMIAFAESQMGLPYIWGGGHGGGLGGPGVGFDCSGFVAAVLNAGGIRNPGGIVTDFYEWMTKNGGNGIVDIGVNNPYADPTVQHIGIRLMGTQYESGGPFGGTGKNGTRFAEWGTPPGWDKASGGLSAHARDNVNWDASIENARRGVKGQWTKMAEGGTIGEAIVGYGQTTGATYLLGEAGKEFVIPETLMPQVFSYFMEVIQTKQVSNGKLVGIPLELRAGLQRVAGKYLASLPGSGPLPFHLPDTRGLNNTTPAPTIPFHMPDTTGLNNRTPDLPFHMPDTRGLNNNPIPADTPALPPADPAKSAPSTIAQGVFDGLTLAEGLLRSVFGTNTAAADPTKGTEAGKKPDLPFHMPDTTGLNSGLPFHMPDTRGLNNNPVPPLPIPQDMNWLGTAGRPVPPDLNWLGIRDNGERGPAPNRMNEVTFRFEIDNRWPDGQQTRDVLVADPVALEDVAAQAARVILTRGEAQQ